MDAVRLITTQMDHSHDLLEQTMADVTPELAQWVPPGVANPIGATYAHAVLAEDKMLNEMLKGTAPLAATTFAGKMGLSELPPQGGDGLLVLVLPRRLHVGESVPVRVADQAGVEPAVLDHRRNGFGPAQVPEHDIGALDPHPARPLRRQGLPGPLVRDPDRHPRKRVPGAAGLGPHLADSAHLDIRNIDRRDGGQFRRSEPV